jgi:type IV secretion system protein VirB2
MFYFWEGIMNLLTHLGQVGLAAAAGTAIVFAPELAHAANDYQAAQSMPWHGPIDQISTSLQGPVAKAVGAGSIAASGLAVAMGDSQSMVRRAGGVAIGGAVAFNAASWGLPLLGYSGAMIL